MNVATPGTELPLAGMTTAIFGPGFTFRMHGRPVNAQLDTTHPDMFLVRADLVVGLVDRPVYIVCESEEDRRNVLLFIISNDKECDILTRHQPNGIQYLWMHLGSSRQYAIRAAE